jgi:hypothetical protein
VLLDVLHSFINMLLYLVLAFTNLRTCILFALDGGLWLEL